MHPTRWPIGGWSKAERGYFIKQNAVPQLCKAKMPAQLRHGRNLEKMMKTTNLFWSLSLIVIGICLIILAGANLLRFDLPDLVTRLVGLVDLAALLVLGYTTVKKLKDRRQ